MNTVKGDALSAIFFALISRQKNMKPEKALLHTASAVLHILRQCRKILHTSTGVLHQIQTSLFRWITSEKLRTFSARTIRDKLDGIVTYWTFRHISNAKMEGFNNKIRWLIKQAYGFRDREYFKLKIYQLPEISSKKSI